MLKNRATGGALLSRKLLGATRMKTKPERGRKTRRFLSPVRKHSVTIAGQRTGISVEDQFWDGLCEIARNENTSAATLIGRIDTDRAGNNLSSSIRLFVLNYFKTLSKTLPSKASSDSTQSAHNQVG